MGKVVFCGENPGLRLYRAGHDEPAVIASWWRCDWSPHGTGQAVVLWTDGGAGLPVDLRGVYTAEPELAGWLNATFTRHFPEFAGVDVGALPVRAAALDGDATTVSWCHGGHRVELIWADELDQRTVQITDFVDGSTGHDLSTVFCPCGTASIRIDDEPVRVTPQVERGARSTSTAFLARCEVWTVRP